jgi:hypothetical protein
MVEDPDARHFGVRRDYLNLAQSSGVRTGNPIKPSGSTVRILPLLPVFAGGYRGQCSILFHSGNSFRVS